MQVSFGSRLRQKKATDANVDCTSECSVAPVGKPTLSHGRSRESARLGSLVVDEAKHALDSSTWEVLLLAGTRGAGWAGSQDISERPRQFSCR